MINVEAHAKHCRVVNASINDSTDCYVLYLAVCQTIKSRPHSFRNNYLGKRTPGSKLLRRPRGSMRSSANSGLGKHNDIFTTFVHPHCGIPSLHHLPEDTPVHTMRHKTVHQVWCWLLCPGPLAHDAAPHHTPLPSPPLSLFISLSRR